METYISILPSELVGEIFKYIDNPSDIQKFISTFGLESLFSNGYIWENAMRSKFVNINLDRFQLNLRRKLDYGAYLIKYKSLFNSYNYVKSELLRNDANYFVSLNSKRNHNLIKDMVDLPDNIYYITLEIRIYNYGYVIVIYSIDADPYVASQVIFKSDLTFEQVFNLFTLLRYNEIYIEKIDDT